MITIHNAKTINGDCKDLVIPSDCDTVIDAEGKLTALPALIDDHVHFRTPGHEYKEDWCTAARAAIASGVTTVIDMPNNNPTCITLEQVKAKKALINQQLAEVGIPLRYELYLGADKHHLEEMRICKDECIGLKVFMGSSTGGLLMDDDASLEKAFQMAAKEDILVAVHAEDECILRMKKQAYGDVDDPSLHPKIRHRSAAITATQKAINLARKYGTRLYVLHLGTKEEVALIRQAKADGVKVYAETTPQHLLLTDRSYGELGTRMQINPPIRTQEDQDALWEGVHDQTIDCIGTDHAPHTIEEKSQRYGKAPSGMPGVQTFLPLMLDACNNGKLTLEELMRCTRINPAKLFNLPPNEDWVLVDMDKEKLIRDEDMLSKCGWTAFAGRVTKGWPVYTILRGKVYCLDELQEKAHANLA